MSYNIELNISRLLANNNECDFDDIALAVFQYQYANNPLYNAFVKALKINPGSVTKLGKIPFLPVSFFKTHEVITGNKKQGGIKFESSGTTGEHTSTHYVNEPALYDQSILSGFNSFYGNPEAYAIIGLLPSYLERKNASLIYMVNLLMQQSRHPANGFYLNEMPQLYERLLHLEQNNQPVILIGVTFALLDFAAQFPIPLSNTIVMETGGMKGRRDEMTRAEVHSFLKEKFNLSEIHSEYGMTEMLSQAYSKKDGLFNVSNSLKVMVRDVNDPLLVSLSGTGGINIIDLANVNSCSFIATDDIGRVHRNGSFEVHGRLDYSVLRGCNLLVV